MTTRIIESAHVAEAPEALWREIGGFGAVGKWHPWLARVDSEGEHAGCRRIAGGRDGSRQVERLLEASPERHFYRYRMESTGMPVRDYVGELRVENDGAPAVAERYRKDADSFETGGKSRLEVLQKGTSGDLGFWTGFQVATVKPSASAAPLEMRIRVTEVFRNMDGEWKLVHRHADLAKA